MSQTACKPRVYPARDYLADANTSEWLEQEQHTFLKLVNFWHEFITREPAASTASEEFENLAAAWEQETRHQSSLTQIVLNANYQRIIGMGDRALPLILSRLKSFPGHWFWALSAITGENPIAPEDAGDAERMTEAWLRWAKEHGFLPTRE